MKQLTVILVVLYVIMLGYVSFSRVDVYHPDFMNYVDVARHLLRGEGLVQASFGFNQNAFPVNGSIQSYYVSQAPFYPILIAAVALFIPNVLIAAAVVSTISHLLLLYFAYRLASILYEGRTAILTVILLLFYLPLQVILQYTLSETLACVFLLAAFTSFLRRSPFLAGLLAGLAFATRYAMAPSVLVLCTGIIIEGKSKFKSCAMLFTGFAVPGLLILGHHLEVTGRFVIGPHEGQEGFIPLFIATIRGISGEYSSLFPSIFSAKVWSMILFFITTILFYKLRGKIFSQLFQNQRYLLLIWPLFYLGFLIIERSHRHFDYIDVRLIFPAGLTLLIAWSALFIAAFNPDQKKMLFLTCVAACVAFLQTSLKLKQPFSADPRQAIEHSETLKWISQNTGPEDLIIINDAPDIPFIFNYPSVYSYSYVPDTDPMEEKTILNLHADGNIYFIFRTQYAKNRNFGTFIHQLVHHPYANPHFRLLRKTDDGWIFQVVKSNLPLEKSPAFQCSK